MSKEIFLYSEDKKYKCGVELADSLDNFGCPDHSSMVLVEERENGTYIIAQAKDKRLETEKDQKIVALLDEIDWLKQKIFRIQYDCDQCQARHIKDKDDLEAKLEQYEKFMKDNEWDSIEEMQN